MLTYIPNIKLLTVLKILRIILLLLPIVTLSACNKSEARRIKITLPKVDSIVSKLQELRMAKNIDEVYHYILTEKKYNEEIGFFVNMKIPSGKNRFFIYSFNEKKMLDQGLVAHGSGSETGKKDSLKFSNEMGSLCTSLGKYSIGYSYIGQYGKAYKLYGLDSTNSRAFARSVVLHYFDKVPHDEQNIPICNSFGCPMVNKTFFHRIEKYLDASEKNIILSIF